MQHKDLDLEACQLKFSSDDKTGEFEGYASAFNSNDAVNDTILPGAFEKIITSGKQIAGFLNHDHHDVPVIDWKDMSEDDYGLKVTGQIDLNHHIGPSLHSAMKREALSGLSIGFRNAGSKFEEKEDGGRIYEKVNLFEISACTFPCEDKARITAVKHVDLEVIENWKDAEEILRDGGFSHKGAKKLVSLLKELAFRDVEQLKETAKQNADLVSNRLMQLIKEQRP